MFSSRQKSRSVASYGTACMSVPARRFIATKLGEDRQGNHAAGRVPECAVAVSAVLDSQDAPEVVSRRDPPSQDIGEGACMGSARDRAPDSKNPCDAVRPSWTLRVRPRPMSGISLGTPSRRPRPAHPTLACSPDSRKLLDRLREALRARLEPGGKGVRSPVDAFVAAGVYEGVMRIPSIIPSGAILCR